MTLHPVRFACSPSQEKNTVDQAIVAFIKGKSALRLNKLGACPGMPFRPNSSESSKNNARNISYMAVLIFHQFFDFDQVSADSEMPILGQAPSFAYV